MPNRVAPALANVPMPPTIEPIAIISDIHGNIEAAQAVLADIHAQGIHRTGYQNGFGGHKIAGMGNPVAGDHFQTGTAHADQIQTLGPGGLGLGLDGLGLDLGLGSGRVGTSLGLSLGLA